MKENSIEDDIKNAEHFIDSIKKDKEYKEENGWHGYYNKEIIELARILQHIVSDYKRVLKENEELKGLIAHKNGYAKKLEEDLFENCSNYVVSVQKVKDKIEELNKKEQELQNSINAEERKDYSDANIGWELMDINIRRETLQELLESEEK